MKAIRKATLIVGCLMLLVANVGFAQELTQQQLDAAKQHFQKVAEQSFVTAYKAQTGMNPSAAETTRAMKQYNASIGAFATSLGTQAGREAKRLANLRKGFDALSGTELIDVLKETRQRTLPGFGFDKAKVVELCRLEMSATQIDGRLLVKDPNVVLQLENNTELVFPKGTYTIDLQKVERVLVMAKKRFPKGIAFVGAGKDETTLKITDGEFAAHDIDHLCFRSMTIDCDNDGLFDKRQGSLSLRFDSVRLLRFDAGHGGCKLFSINHGIVVHATETDFIGGFGRSPGHGSVFDSCDIFLGYFQSCSFIGIEYDLFRSIRERSALIWMDDCSFDRKQTAPACIELENCKFDATTPEIKWTPQEDTAIVEAQQ